MNSSNPDWQKLFDESSGQYYYHNIMTNETSWELPESGEIFGEQPSEEANVNDTLNDDNVPAEHDDASYAYDDNTWEELHDENSGKYYYHNISTGLTSWEMPEKGKIIKIKDGISSDVDISYSEEISADILFNEIQDNPSSNVHDSEYAEYMQRSAVSKDMDSKASSHENHEKLIASMIGNNVTLQELCSVFEHFYMQEFIEQNYNFERKGIFKSRFCLFYLFFYFLFYFYIPLIIKTTKILNGKKYMYLFVF